MHQSSTTARTRPAARNTKKPQPFRIPYGWYLAGVVVFFLAGAEIYGPAMNGSFVYDDLALPFNTSGGLEVPLRLWLAGVRPALMFTYWLNYWNSGTATFGYHFTNLVIHVLSACMVFLIVRRVLELARTERPLRDLLAALFATLFLAHPLQAESVAYVAGRSESLSGLFTLAAWCVFLYREEAGISWRRSLTVLLLFGLAVTTKEHSAALFPLLLLTDWFWGGPKFLATLRANWRLYIPMTAASLAALAFVASILARATSAGFGITQFTWYQYLFTQGRSMAEYVRLFFLPIGQTIDHDLPISYTIFSHGAVLYLLAFVGLAALAIRYRKIYPLASFGFLTFLLLLAPTSSVIPIFDPIAERRMYLPIIGLMFVVIELLRRRDLSRTSWRIALSALVLLACWATYRQAEIWADPWSLWSNAIEQAPERSRPYSNLAITAVAEHRCADAVPYLERADRVLRDDVVILTAWAKVFECTGNKEAALQKLQRAASLSPSSGSFEMLGLLYGEMGDFGKSKDAIDRAVALAPNSATAISARGIWYFEQGRYDSAAADFRAALGLNPSDFATRRFLWLAESKSGH